MLLGLTNGPVKQY